MTGAEWNDWSDAAAPKDAGEGKTAEEIVNRLVDFLWHWSRDEYDDMLGMCTAGWKAGTENPAEALLAILDERRPITCSPLSVSGTDEDTVRTVNIKMDIRKTDKAWEHDYLFHIILQQENDGIWRIDPGSLMDYEILEKTY